ncbi:hypothetical protein E2C01_083852 [Portunus trituberculatus]|uniref:Uncharacterized protein n=1 Tax=Portunus trituberculatus TaxID=210409 RepID=A0A5B7J7N6_PORTR|nr:hypothetical protein [Portunus trituberculatus]
MLNGKQRGRAVFGAFYSRGSMLGRRYCAEGGDRVTRGWVLSVF